MSVASVALRPTGPAAWGTCAPSLNLSAEEALWRVIVHEEHCQIGRKAANDNLRCPRDGRNAARSNRGPYGRLPATAIVAAEYEREFDFLWNDGDAFAEFRRSCEIPLSGVFMIS